MLFSNILKISVVSILSNKKFKIFNQKIFKEAINDRIFTKEKHTKREVSENEKKTGIFKRLTNIFLN